MRVHLRSVGFLSALIILGNLGPPAFAAQCGPLQVITSLQMTPLGPGNVVTVPVTIADKEVRFLVDTGGAFSYVSAKVVEEMNLPVRESVRQIGVAGKTVSHREARLPSIVLGTTRQDGVYLMVQNPTDGKDDPFQGSLAPDMLMNADVDFDFGANKLNLISQQHCDGKVVYWSAPKLAVVAFRLDSSGHISFPMTLDGKRVNAILDTGSTNTDLNLNVARRAFNIDVNAPDVERTGELKGGFTANVYRRKFKVLAVEGVTVNEPMITLLPDLMNTTSEQRPTGSLVREIESGTPELILGMSVLSKLHVYIAYKERKVYITAASPAPAGTAPAQ